MYLKALQEAQTYTIQDKGRVPLIDTTGGALVFFAWANPQSGRRAQEMT